MLTATSVVSQAHEKMGATSLVEGLFGEVGIMSQLTENIGHVTRITPTNTSSIECSHCHRTAFSIVGNTIVVVERHDSKYHKTVISLDDLGLTWQK